VVEFWDVAARSLEAAAHEEALEEDGCCAEGELGQFEHDPALDDEVDAFCAELSLFN
jgi:hypothetical protein